MKPLYRTKRALVLLKHFGAVTVYLIFNNSTHINTLRHTDTILHDLGKNEARNKHLKNTDSTAFITVGYNSIC